MSAEAALRLLARGLPPLARERYLEEWRADAAGAREAGSSPLGVLVGAAVINLTIDRDLPAHTGEPRGAAPRRLARRGIALLIAATLVLAGIWLTGGGIVPEGSAATPGVLGALATIGWVLVRASAFTALLAAVYLVRAAVLARTWRARAALIAIVLAIGLFGVGALAPGLSPGAIVSGLLLGALGLVGGLVVLGGSTPIALLPRSATRPQRLPLALGGLALVLTVIVVGAVDLLVWNPQAKVPNTDLALIYGYMVARDGFDVGAGVTMVVVWAAFWALAALVVVAFSARRRDSGLTPRRIAILMLGIVAAAIVMRFFAGFSFGMSIADTFATSGGDASLVSAILPVVGQLACAAAAITLGWAPRPARNRMSVAPAIETM